MQICRTTIFLAFFSLVFCSCASVSVERVASIENRTPETRPDQIFVAPFEVEADALRVGRTGEDLTEFRRALGKSMQKQLIAYLSQSIAPAAPAGERTPRGNFWLIEGKFTYVNQGSRALRSIVGYGLGRTKMETETKVSSLKESRRKPLLLIETTGGSNLSPGALGTATFPISGPMALTSLIGVVDGFRSGISFDMHRTAREITAALSEELHRQGAISDEELIRAKRKGDLPDSFWPTDAPPLESAE